MDLLIEIKILIASFDQETWIKMVLYDNYFHKYAYSDIGRRQFIDLFTVIKVNSNLTSYTLFGKLHRDYLPAIIYRNGERKWGQNGKVHRTDGPAVIYVNGGQCWCQNSKIHRIDGPALIYASGEQYWYKNEKLHRIGGPAIIYSDGTREWRQNGKRM